MAEYDVLIITDSTGSMTSYLASLRTSLPEILALSALSGSFGRIGIMAYTDYSLNRDVISWSGWNAPDLAAFARRLNPIGNHDTPEASKTALIHALKEVDETKKTVILWYTDAPPHHASEPDHNTKFEEQAFPKGGTDWVKLANEAAKKNCTVFAFADHMADKAMSFWAFLCQTTGGACLNVQTSKSAEISRITLDVLLAFMRETPELESSIYGHTKIAEFAVSPVLANPKPINESEGSYGYLPPPTKRTGAALLPVQRLAMTDFSRIPTWSRDAPLELAKRFSDKENTEYRSVVFSSLENLIDKNVVALTYNPIFGTIWRAVCKERLSEQRDRLVNLFSQQVASISDSTQRETMKAWLEASYDSSGDILAIMETAPDHGDPAQKRMYLDLDSEVHLTRMEVLEVARSCYPGVLEKIATMFTHAKIVEPNVVLTPNQRSIPISLPPKNLFQILPHLVVPGTLFSNRAASLMAVLALVVGVPFLKEPATEFLAWSKGTWLNTEVPENLSFECAKFLLSAPEGVVLTDEEREVYAGMRRYRLLELNLDAALVAKVPWMPEKVRGVGDRMVECKTCKIKRSTTIMTSKMEGVCGMCCVVEEYKQYIAKGGDPGTYNKPQDPLDHPNEKGEMDSCWVECSVKTCRAQYIVQNVARLNVRPKCYYCRQGEPCPSVECTTCLNKVIVPLAYRTEGPYSCPACESAPTTKRETIVDQETSARGLVAENKVGWLGLTPNDDLFLNKSAFKLFAANGPSFFKWTHPKPGLSLILDAKPIHNAQALIEDVEARVGTGKIEYGTCSLCFDDHPFSKLMPACGRSGCKQRVDEACLEQWYARNEVGKLLNLMRLTCPFCRRVPTTKTMARFNKGAAALGGLKTAIDTPGWFYAWCTSCNFAKQAVERACCDGDRVPAIQDFCCEECVQARVALRARLEAEARALREQAAADQAQRRRLAELERQTAALQGNGDAAAVRITPCPRCGVMVEKSYGCNHISCHCGAHFCHVCGEEASAGAIYEHMTAAHGGIYDEDDEY